MYTIITCDQLKMTEIYMMVFGVAKTMEELTKKIKQKLCQFYMALKSWWLVCARQATDYRRDYAFDITTFIIYVNIYPKN